MQQINYLVQPFFNSLSSHDDHLFQQYNEQNLKEIQLKNDLKMSFQLNIQCQELKIHGTCQINAYGRYMIIQNSQHQHADHVLNIEFAYLRMIKDASGIKIGFELNKNDIILKFLNQNSEQKINRLIKYLDNFTVRNESLTKYQIHDQIGEGTQAKVFRVTKSHQESSNCMVKEYAVKVISKTDHSPIFECDQLLNEIRNQRALNCSKYVVRLHKVYETNDNLYLLMDYIKDGSLYDLIKQRSLTLQQSLNICQQILKGLRDLSQHKIIHRDLKPTNILVTYVKSQIRIKIIDFGISTRRQSKKHSYSSSLVFGTPGYIAPEIFHLGYYTEKADIFSVGIILYNLITYRGLFRGKNSSDILKKNINMKIEHELDVLSIVKPQCIIHLLQGLLAKNYKQRFTIDEALNDQCFKEILKHSKNGKLQQKNEQVIQTDFNSLQSSKILKENICCGRNCDIEKMKQQLNVQMENTPSNQNNMVYREQPEIPILIDKQIVDDEEIPNEIDNDNYLIQMHAISMDISMHNFNTPLQKRILI